MRQGAYRVALGAVALAALAVRLAGTDWGKPYAYHFDEPFILKPALRMVESGDPNPHFFRYPSLMIYVEAAIAGANHVLRGMPLDVPEGPAHGPSDLGTWTWPALAGGRHVVAVIGAAAVVLAGALAKHTGGPSAGLLAAALLTVFPLHVEHSHYLTTDVPAATFLLAAFLSVSALRGPTFAAACAGAAVGLAIATKYTAATALPALALLAMLPYGPLAARLGRVGVMIAACGLAFALACPYALLDSATFAAELNIVRDHYTSGHLGAEGVWNWRWYIARLRDDGLGAAGLALIVIGAAGTVYDAARSRLHRLATVRALVILCLALAWFAWLGSVTVRFERNLMPAAVLACPAMGHGLASLLGALSIRGRVLGVLGWLFVALALVGPATKTLEVTRKLSAPDTRGQALAWIQSNVAPGSHIVREEYTPQPDAERYRIEYVWSLGFSDPRDYRRIGVDYLIASQAVYARFLNDPSARYPEVVEHYRRIFRLPVVAAFLPDKDGTGPAVTIYRVGRATRRRER